MEPSPKTIFISYARKDGRAFAEEFERRLAAEGIRAWRDIQDMGSGDILPQVLRAIESAKHLVLILSARALLSDWIKREWSHARMVGKRVSPVLADPAIQRADLPPWIRREEIYDIAEPERWTQLVRVLQGPGETRRVPYMPGDLPANFVPRPAEYARLKQAVLSAGTDQAVALTTALRGAGGYGKTTLANYLCHDPDVRFEFTDGILRVEIGKERDDVTKLVIDLIEKLDPEGKRPGFQDVVTASEHLGELIGEARLLLVIDDVWKEAQLCPFLRGGSNCVRLVTTRLPQVLSAAHVPIKIDEMRANEAAELISKGLPVASDPAVGARLAALADRLGNWALLLAIANGWIGERIALGEGLLDAVERFEERLKKRGLAGFDPRDEQQRNRAIRVCVEASLEDLGASEQARLGELAALPEDEDVSLAIIAALWAETGELEEDQTDDLVQRLHALSLLQSLDLSQRTLRLHDIMIRYLRDRIGKDGCCAAHAAMVQALSASCGGHWEQLPQESRYGWKFLIRHLRDAAQDGQADRLLTDYHWIKAKLRASGAFGLLEAYLPEPLDEEVRLVGRAVALSVSALAANPLELARQIYGRLGHFKGPIAISLATAARNDAEFCPSPRWSGLTPPGAERLRLVGHEAPVRSAGFSPDGRRIVTASDDGTARLWDGTTGQEIAVLRGHEGPVQNAAFSPDGRCVITTSADCTARLWEALTGQEVAILPGCGRAVRSAAFSPDGRRILTASDDRTARLWEAAAGQEVAVLCGHRGRVQSAAFSPDGRRIVTASDDRTARLWDGTTGQEIAVLHGHKAPVQNAAFSPDGRCIVTTSNDGTARLWEAATGQEVAVLHGQEGPVQNAAFSFDSRCIVTVSTSRTARLWEAAAGQEVALLRGHGSLVRSAAFSPDGRRILTASDDRTARLWEALTGQEVAALPDHGGPVQSAAFSPDGRCIVTTSDDGTARLWEALTGQEISVLRNHGGRLRSAAFSPDGRRIVTASNDRTARFWDALTEQEVGILRGHGRAVRSAAFSPDGRRIVTASDDRTARLWDGTTGQEIAVLHGHEGPVRSTAFSPDGHRIVTASVDCTARLWDGTTGREIAILYGHVRWVQSAAFSPNSCRIVTASSDRTARLWDGTTGQEIAVLRGHEGRVRGAAFSSDGRRIVTASSDRTARFWDAGTGQQVAQVALDAAVTALAVHENAIALGDGLGRIHVFADAFVGTKEADGA